MANIYDLEEAFKQIEDDLVNQVINGIKKTTSESELKDDNITVWKTKQLKELQEFKKRNKKYFTEDRKKELYGQIEDALKDVYATAGSAQQRKILDAVEQGLKVKRKAKDEEITAGFNGVNDRKLNALVKETQKNLYNAQTSAARYAEDQYKQIIFNSNVYFNTGTGNLVKCIDKATRNFLEAGINNIEYKNGRRVNIQSYAEMALRTAEKRSYIQGEATMRDNYGLGLVIVNRRGNACPKCMQFVGRIFNDDVYGSQKPDPRFPLLSDAIAGGLYHPNCKDVHTTYFEGITTKYPAPTKMQKEEAEKQYMLEQQQRLNERQIRKYKRLADGTLDEEKQKEYKSKVSQWQARQRQLIEENPTLRRKYWRESILGKVKPDTKTFGIPESPVINNFSFESLKKTMSEEDFTEFKNMIEENEFIENMFSEKYTERLDGIKKKKDGGAYNPSTNVIEYDFVAEKYQKNGVNKFHTLSHEYGHFLDHKIYELTAKEEITFKEIEILKENLKNNYYGKHIYENYFDVHKISLSDQYLAAIQKDVELIKPKIYDTKKVYSKVDEELKQLYESMNLKYEPPVFKNQFLKNLKNDDVSLGFQDFLDGVFHREETGLRWGHGNSYYNRYYNAFKDFKLQNNIKTAYTELGFDASNQSKVKELMRRYDTSSELWANQFAALAAGGKELEIFEKEMPNSIDFIKKILK